MNSRLIITDIAKSFSRKRLFRNITVELSGNNSLAVTGPNGSGKSTLVEIAAGIRRPDTGNVQLLIDGSAVDRKDFMKYAGFCSPRIFPYEDLSGYENILFALKKKDRMDTIDPMLERFLLLAHKNKPVRYYSTGMRQRLKFILAIINDPPVLFLDEPGTNLDDAGKTAMYDMIRELHDGHLIMIATNDTVERKLCDGEIRLGE